jgi:hypothetical protein
MFEWSDFLRICGLSFVVIWRRWDLSPVLAVHKSIFVERRDQPMISIGSYQCISNGQADFWSPI